MYVRGMPFLVNSLQFTKDLISYKSSDTLIPQPLFESSPGFIIHIFFSY